MATDTQIRNNAADALPNNLRIKNGKLSTLDNVPVEEYLRTREAFINTPDKDVAVLVITRDSLARILAHYQELQAYKRDAELAKLAAAEQVAIAV